MPAGVEPNEKPAEGAGVLVPKVDDVCVFVPKAGAEVEAAAAGVCPNWKRFGAADASVFAGVPNENPALPVPVAGLFAVAVPPNEKTPEEAAAGFAALAPNWNGVLEAEGLDAAAGLEASPNPPKAGFGGSALAAVLPPPKEKLGLLAALEPKEKEAAVVAAAAAGAAVEDPKGLFAAESGWPN